MISLLHLIWIIPLTVILSIMSYSLFVIKSSAEKECDAFEKGFDCGFKDAMREFGISNMIYVGRDVYGKGLIKNKENISDK